MHVAVLGAGYAGLSLARQLESTLPDDVTLTVVDERDTHLVQHLIHRAIRHPDIADDLRLPLSDLLDRADHRQARVTAVDPEAGTVQLGDGELAYDLGAVCLGARTDFHGLPGVAEHATPLKRLAHADAIREEFHEVCAAEGTTVVGGAGLSGIQAAGELAALADDEATTDVEVRLLEQAERVAPSFPGAFQDAVADELRVRGVSVETGRTISGVVDGTVVCEDGDDVAFDQLVWTGGIVGQAAMDDRRPDVRARLRLTDRTLALGDAARVVDAEGQPAPASAQTALGQADVAATNLARLVEHRQAGGDGFAPQLSTYRYDSRGWLVTVGDGAVAQVGPTVVRGRAARTLKTSVTESYLRSLTGGPGLLESLRGVVRGRE
ncbi:NAD(P)/FAD-dependent oxidoreductase [Halobacteriales archaeon Cl-PHB]